MAKVMEKKSEYEHVKFEVALFKSAYVDFHPTFISEQRKTYSLKNMFAIHRHLAKLLYTHFCYVIVR